MSEVKWIKITTDIFDDEKILLIESLPECDSIIVIWFKLLCFAGKTNNSGVFLMGDSIPYTDGMLATIFRRKEATVKMALDIFERFGMIERLDGITDCRKKELVQFCRNADNEDLIMILQAAIQSNPGLASKLFITLTEGCGYDKICTFASVPARKTDYQAYLRKALKILNDMLLLKNMPADFPAEKYSETDFQK